MKYDVVVVGAGPAGSTAAKFLSENGISVLLVDKSKFPRDKSCGGGIPVRVLKEYKYIEEKGLIESYSYGGFIHSPSLKYRGEVQRNEPFIAMVLRKKFDFGLVNSAIDDGAIFIDNMAVDDIEISENKAKVMLNDGTDVESRMVVGADGIWSVVAKKSGLSHNHRDISISLFQEYPMSAETLDRYFTKKRLFHIHFNVKGIAGYGWVFPKKEHVNIGVVEMKRKLGSEEKTYLKEIFNDYIQLLKESKTLPSSFKVGKIQGAVLPTCPVEKTYADRVLLCGDAAGLIHPFNGEGIEYAMSSGRIAADVIAEALEVDDTSAKFLSKYEKLWKNDFGKTIKLFLRTSKRLEEKTEKLVKLISRDKIIAELALDIGMGNSTIHDCKWTIAKRLLYLRFKDLFHRG